MTTRALPLLVPLLALLVPAAAGAAEDLIVSSTWPDLAHSKAHWQKLPLVALWDQPSFAPVRKALSAAMDAEKLANGVDLAAVFGDIASERESLSLENGQWTMRLALRCPTTADAAWAAVQATAHPATPTPVFESMVWGRNGAWLYGVPASTRLAPAMPAEIPAAATAAADAAGADAPDCRGIVDVAALCHAIGNDSFTAAVKRLNLTRGTYAIHLTDDGSRDDGDLPGAVLPVAPVDGATLSRLPGNAILVLAAGLDGPGLVTMWQGLDADPALHDALEKTSGASAGFLNIAIPELLKNAGGTYCLAVTPGAPFPGVTVMIPATPAIDGVLDRLAGLMQLDLKAARSAPVVVPIPKIPVLVQIERSDRAWIISSDPTLFDRDAGAADAFNLAQLQAGLTPGGLPGDARPVMVSWQDGKQEARLLATTMTMASAGMRAARANAQANAQTDAAADATAEAQARNMALTIQALTVIAPHLPTSVALAYADQDGLHARVRNGLVQVSIVSVLAGMMIPAVAMVRVSHHKAVSGNNERQLVLGCMVWCNDHDQQWPADLAAMLKDNPQISAKLLVDPNDPTNPRPYLYIRPDDHSSAQQPVIVEDPACYTTATGSMVCYADGHVGWSPGTALWDQARKLAADPAAATTGISATQWGLAPTIPSDQTGDQPATGPADAPAPTATGAAPLP